MTNNQPTTPKDIDALASRICSRIQRKLPTIPDSLIRIIHLTILDEVMGTPNVAENKMASIVEAETISQTPIIPSPSIEIKKNLIEKTITKNSNHLNDQPKIVKTVSSAAVFNTDKSPTQHFLDKTFGSWLKMVRKHKKLTIEEAASLTKLTENTIFEIESGMREASPNKAKIISEAFGYTFNY